MTSIVRNNYFVDFPAATVSEMEAADTGNKFANLARIHSLVNVPEAMCVTVDFFLDALSEQPELSRFLEDYFAELQTTFGCFLVDSVKTLARQAETFVLSPVFVNLLDEHMREVFGDFEGCLFAVRSSARNEDTESKSFAGIYDSVLNAGGLDGIIDAVCRVWRSYYSYPAIVARIRAECYRPFPEINVIIQRMVSCRIAGVSFSRPPLAAADAGSPASPYIEWVRGNGEKLVSGNDEVSVYYPGGDERDVPRDIEEKLAAVSRTTHLLREAFGYEIDVEWAWDELQLYILQVRPVTTQASGTIHSSEPFVEVRNLYSGRFIDNEEDLGDCGEIYRLYVKKRAPAYILAAKHGVATGLSLVLQFNRGGVESRFHAIDEAVKSSPIDRVILDLDRNIRQTIIPKDRLDEFLLHTYERCDSAARHTVICRDFIAGDYGFISQLLPGRRLLLEISSQGLMDINRGLADCSEIICRKSAASDGGVEIESFSEDSDELAGHFTIATIASIFAFTEAMNASFPNVKLEWVLHRKEPFFIDYSTESAGWDYPGEDRSQCRIISRGVAQGPVFRLEGKNDLSRLSISPGVSVNRIDDMLASNEQLFALIQEIKHMEAKPVIVARRPYAVLSYVLEDVAGFVFEGGSLLCHLAILIREAGLPALICRQVEEVLAGKKTAIISHDMIIGGD